MNKKSFLLGIVFTILFLILLSLNYDFVLDDAFITYRYAENLAHHHGIIWNISQNPVEGYTSFFWVILNALGILLHIDPVIFSKILSALAAVSIIWILALRSKGLDFSLSAIFIGAIALSPPFAFLTIQGMETAFTAMLLLMVGLLSLLILSKPSTKYISIWYAMVVLGFLARPDTAAFSGGVLLGMVAIFILNKDYKTLYKLCILGFPFLIIGAVYMIWRLHYFGYLFPNTFYIKLGSAGNILKGPGIKYISSFFVKILSPYLIISVFLLRYYFIKKHLAKILPILLGCIFFGFYLLAVNPIQGFFWRFIFPIYPAFLLAFVYYFEDLKIDNIIKKRKFWSIVMVLIFALWTLRHIPSTLYEKEQKTQYDRVLVGKGLAGLQGTMFISESGALPYYSKWQAVDLLGLNSEEIAHNGISIQILESINPDMIMLLSHSKGGKYIPIKVREEIVNEYMIEHGFIAVASSHKSFNNYHFYFVRKSSKLFEEIVERLLHIKNVQYGNLEEQISEMRIPIFISDDNFF